MAGETVLVLGIDPGTRATGYGLVRETSGVAVRVASGVIRPPVNAPMCARLGWIFQGLAELLDPYLDTAPIEISMEEAFAGKNTASALKLGQARGAAMAACAVRGLAVTGYSPSTVKQSLVGHGRAEKSQVAFMVAQCLGLKAKLASDEADALAIALCHLNHRRMHRLTRS